MDLMNLKEAERLLEKYKIPCSRAFLAGNLKEAALSAKKTGFPIVVKTANEKIIHKSEAGGVAVNIKNNQELESAYRLMVTKTKSNAVYIQRMEPGKELIVGMKRDESFGPILMFGLGGIFVEVLKDVSFRIAPVNKKEADAMIREIKSFQILTGIRGEKPVDLNKISTLIQNLGKLSMENPGIQQIDFNPVIVNENKAVVVDARVLL